MSLSNNFPVNSSNLNLSLANAGRLDPRVTFTRASTGTYYDGHSSAKAEENLLLQSQDFATTWSANNITVSANSVAAPDGTTTADTVAGNAGTALKRATQGATATSGSFTFSVFAKANTHNFIQFFYSGTGDTTYANFDVSTGTAGNVSGTSSITAVGNGWYRCVHTFTANANTAVNITLVDSNTAVRAETTATTNSVYLWGAQLEQRSSVTSYTATTTAPITNYIPVLQTAAADVPRFDHNPTTRAALGLLVEEQRVNSWTYSDDFANAAWSKTRSSITSNTIVAPNGTLTGDKLVEDSTASNTHAISQSFTADGTSTYTFSVFAKQAESNRNIRLALGPGFVNFNLLTGAFVDQTSATAYSSSAVGNGWYRFSLSIAGLPAGSRTPTVFITDSTFSNSYTGNGYSGIYLWGAQVEAGAFPTSYIATTTASVTRNADVASMTGTNFSAWYNATEGSLFGQFMRMTSTNSSQGRVLSLSDASNTALIEIYQTGGNDPAAQIINTSTQAQWTPTGFTVGVPVKQILAYKLNDSNASFNRSSETPDTACTIPTVTQANIGNRQDGVRNLNGYVQRLAYYPVRATNAQLQALTG
jgi:hypothetical protein